MPPILQLRGIDASYGKAQILFGIDLHVLEGEVVAVIGANGSGKSTMLRVITGLLRPTAGTVVFRGEPIDRFPPHTIVARGISMVPQYRRIFGSLTVEENLEIGAYTRHRDRQAFLKFLDEAYRLFPVLAQKRYQLGGVLSGGEQQMLSIARGLMAQPSLLLLDEPSMGLAPKLIVDVFRDIRRIAESGRTVVVVEQNAYAALSIARRGYVLENGRIALAGAAQDLFHNAYVRKTY
ncbi:MAG TPA: ABC transporter ATP-binding protein, partial [bacterium]|nr:ABC transporter ATP-binding protein [bacterium]